MKIQSIGLSMLIIFVTFCVFVRSYYPISWNETLWYCLRNEESYWYVISNSNPKNINAELMISRLKVCFSNKNEMPHANDLDLEYLWKYMPAAVNVNHKKTLLESLRSPYAGERIVALECLKAIDDWTPNDKEILTNLKADSIINISEYAKEIYIHAYPSAVEE